MAMPIELQTGDVKLTDFARFLADERLLSHAEASQLVYDSQQNQVTFTQALLNSNLLGDKIIAQSIAKYFNLSTVDLKQYQITQLSIELIDQTIIQNHHILPLTKTGNQLLLAVADPTNATILNTVRFHTALDLKLVIAESKQLRHFINQLFAKSHYLTLENFKVSREKNSNDDAPVIKFIDHILTDAIKQNASDIHFEPYQKLLRIRFRIDGILHEITKIDIELAPRFNARLKVMASLDIAEKRLPQDGRFQLNFPNQFNRDCRICTCPTLFGEKVVVRILDTNNDSLQIEQLGLEPNQIKIFNDYLRLPQGMILVTGPTGSGKTVTLYTALNKLNLIDKNISTAEDPVEINLPGINQVEINPKIGLDFATTLKTFLRQDPDVIMVGEIRDFETAQIAIRAAQTGHLVLSTLHTNTATESITRLLNIGILSFNLATSINLFIAQRLVRKLCSHCKQPIAFSKNILTAENIDPNQIKECQLFSAKGCEHCHNGYRGRTAIFELLPISKSISQMIMEQRSTLEIEHQARLQGMQTLRESGIKKLLCGITSLEEINRVTNHEAPNIPMARH